MSSPQIAESAAATLQVRHHVNPLSIFDKARRVRAEVRERAAGELCLPNRQQDVDHVGETVVECVVEAG